jgi:hypothetical protein
MTQGPIGRKFSSLSCLRIKNEISVYLVAVLPQVLERVLIYATQDISACDLQSPHSWDSILLIHNDGIGSLCLGVVNRALVGHINHHDVVAVWERGMPRIPQPQVAMKKSFLHDCLKDEHSAGPTQAYKGKGESGDDDSSSTILKVSSQQCGDTPENHSPNSRGDRSYNSPKQKDETQAHDRAV